MRTMRGRETNEDHRSVTMNTSGGGRVGRESTRTGISVTRRRRRPLRLRGGGSHLPVQNIRQRLNGRTNQPPDCTEIRLRLKQRAAQRTSMPPRARGAGRSRLPRDKCLLLLPPEEAIVADPSQLTDRPRGDMTAAEQQQQQRKSSSSIVVAEIRSTMRDRGIIHYCRRIFLDSRPPAEEEEAQGRGGSRERGRRSIMITMDTLQCSSSNSNNR